jgi:hypothetical protein
MALFVVRVWLPDRPGALGQVASRIGAVHGDVIGIEILERGAGRAIDELVVRLPEDGLVELLVGEIAQVDGVDVEDVRAIAGEPPAAPLSGLAIAERMVRSADAVTLLGGLCVDIAAELECAWVTVVDMDERRQVAAVGEAPTAAWLAAFLAGSSHLESSDDEGQAPPDLAWARLPCAGLELAAGRPGRAFRSLERQQLVLLARVADGLMARSADSTPSGVDAASSGFVQ